jgi:hypothetical protein
VTVVHSPVRSYLRSWAWFWAWAVVGCGVTLGAVSLGVLVFVPVALVAALMASRPTIRRSATGLLTGAGALLLLVAWVQRAGPGTTCWQTATASGCDQHLNPLPWLVAGAVLFVGGIAVHTRAFRSCWPPM